MKVIAEIAKFSKESFIDLTELTSKDLKKL